MNLAEFRGWVEERREELGAEGLESIADFLVKLMVRDRIKGRGRTAEQKILQAIEICVRRCIDGAEKGVGREALNTMDGTLAKFIQLAKKMGVGSEGIGLATMRATRPLT